MLCHHNYPHTGVYFGRRIRSFRYLEFAYWYDGEAVKRIMHLVLQPTEEFFLGGLYFFGCHTLTNTVLFCV